MASLPFLPDGPAPTSWFSKSALEQIFVQIVLDGFDSQRRCRQSKDRCWRLPLDAAFDALQTDAAINFNLLPLPQGKTSKPDKVIKDPKIKRSKVRAKVRCPKI